MPPLKGTEAYVYRSGPTALVVVQVELEADVLPAVQPAGCGAVVLPHAHSAARAAAATTER